MKNKNHVNYTNSNTGCVVLSEPPYDPKIDDYIATGEFTTEDGYLRPTEKASEECRRYYEEKWRKFVENRE